MGKLNIFTLVFVLFGMSQTAFLQLNKTDANGKKQGPWEKKYPNSLVLEYKGQFKDDKPVGTFTYFYPSTKVKMIVKHNDKTGRSEAFIYHENTLLMAHGIFKNQKKDSVWTHFGPSGRLTTRESYKDGLLHGKQIIYYVPEDPNDKSERIAKISNFVKGTLEGEVIEYFDFGTVKTTCKYVNGKKQGVCISNHANGQKMIQESYENGVKHGYFFAYDESGKEIGRKFYKYGRELDSEELLKYQEELKKIKAKAKDPKQQPTTPKQQPSKKS
ncbi:MAG: toxin-antitoxin system YwqK family antitoxin [Crocinitomicaceae bacterium]|nr:MAG: toxin-antitoxin system YwqK family antitoxin [Crocinitomicaceae bacterium]